MYACLLVCAHVFISLHLSPCVCMCVYMCVHMERDVGRSVVKEKPLVTLPTWSLQVFSPNCFSLGTLLTRRLLRVTRPVAWALCPPTGHTTWISGKWTSCKYLLGYRK